MFSNIKFVDNKNFFVSLDGPTISLYTTFGLTSSATITPHNNLKQYTYFRISTLTKDYHFWIDKIGDSTPPDIENPIRIDTSTIDSSYDHPEDDYCSPAPPIPPEDLINAINDTINSIDELDSTIENDSIVVTCNEVGDYDEPKDVNTGFLFTYQLKGYDKCSLLKSGAFGKDIIEVLDVDFTGSTDTLELLVKRKQRIDFGREIGFRKDYNFQYLKIENWVFGKQKEKS